MVVNRINTTPRVITPRKVQNKPPQKKLGFGINFQDKEAYLVQRNIQDYEMRLPIDIVNQRLSRHTEKGQDKIVMEFSSGNDWFDVKGERPLKHDNWFIKIKSLVGNNPPNNPKISQKNSKVVNTPSAVSYGLKYFEGKTNLEKADILYEDTIKLLKRTKALQTANEINEIEQYSKQKIFKTIGYYLGKLRA